MSGSRIAFVITGSIAAYKACDAVSRLVKLGHSVRTVASESALRFVGAATLEGLTGERVLTDLFQAGAALEHIQLTRWADAVVVCPATANTLNRFASGLADDLVGALFLAHDRSKPFLVAPAMNPAMWSHPATAEAVAKLGRWGVRFIQVGDGRTACGEVGEGRMAEPEDVVEAVEAALARPERRLKVLVTSGGTAEPLDGVRVLTNLSTGRTGGGIAGHLARAGHDVLLLRSLNSESAAACREETFLTFADLDAALARILAKDSFDAVVHAAAVGDFGITEISVDGSARRPGAGKLDSDSAPTIRLRAQPKLVDCLKARSRNEAVRVVAFKLTRGGDREEIRRAVASLFERSGAELVVHNDLSERAGAEVFPSEIHFADGSPPLRCESRTALAAALGRILSAVPSAEHSPA
jgi:phosphopantothenoylcysteine decarboxylase/phosphopantothenate--cysteine ligase